MVEPLIDHKIQMGFKISRENKKEKHHLVTYILHDLIRS